MGSKTSKPNDENKVSHETAIDESKDDPASNNEVGCNGECETDLHTCLEKVRERVEEGRRLSVEIEPLYEHAKEFQEEFGEKGKHGKPIKLTLPGSKYIGPGNPINAGEPENTADKIALIHDWAYDFASTQEDVEEADLLAITLFEKEYKRSGNWQALVGKLGLSAKYFIEKKINRVLYPTLPSGEDDPRDTHESSQPTPSAKENEIPDSTTNETEDTA